MVNARLKRHIPEILPIAGRRLFVTYPGQLKQCKRCFEQGHVSTTCNLKVDWLDYIIKLISSGEFKIELFEGWKTALTTYGSDILQNVASNPQNTQDLRGILNFNRAPSQPTAQPTAQPSVQNQSQPSQPIQQQTPWSGINPWQSGQGPNQVWNQPWQQPQVWQGNQGWQQGGTFFRGRGRGRGRGQNSPRNFGPNY